MTARFEFAGRLGRWASAFLLGTILPLAVGCSEKAADPNKGQVTGVVSFQGKPLTQGTINFFGKGNASGTGAIDATGKYSVTLPPGDYQVAVHAAEAAATMDEKGKPVAAKSLVPEKYGDAVKSGLTAKVEKGKSQINFDLKP